VTDGIMFTQGLATQAADSFLRERETQNGDRLLTKGSGTYDSRDKDQIGWGGDELDKVEQV